jgi:hypothetical protein
MDGSPKLVLDGEAVEMLLSLPPAARRRILQVLDQLRHEPPRITEDFSETDPAGRHISVKGIRPVLIRYWLDGPVDEFRVTRLTIVKPWKG